MNHFSTMCKSSNGRMQEIHGTFTDSDGSIVDNDIHHISSFCPIYNTNLTSIGNHLVKMQKDTGASISIISSKIWENIGRPSLSKSSKKLETYDGHQMQ